MQAEMDGEASKEQLATLKEYLASDPEAQRVHAEFAKLTDILNQVEKVEPPRDLRGSIMAALQPRQPALEIGTRSIRSRFRIPLIRYGYALAAGLLLGAVLTGVAFRKLSPLEKADVYGTIAAVENTSHSIVENQMRLAAPGLEGTVELRHSGGNEMLVFDLNSEQGVDVEVTFDGSRAGLEGFHQDPNNIRSLEAKGGRISFRSGGKQRTTVILASESAEVSMNLTFYVGGRLVHRGTLGAAGQAGSAK